jgi:hypothetical protein
MGHRLPKVELQTQHLCEDRTSAKTAHPQRHHLCKNGISAKRVPSLQWGQICKDGISGMRANPQRRHLCNERMFPKMASPQRQHIPKYGISTKRASPQKQHCHQHVPPLALGKFLHPSLSSNFMIECKDNATGASSSRKDNTSARWNHKQGDASTR